MLYFLLFLCFVSLLFDGFCRAGLVVAQVGVVVFAVFGIANIAVIAAAVAVLLAGLLAGDD